MQLSGQRMIVMEWVDGVKLTDEAGLRDMRIRPRTAGLLLLAAFGHMLLEEGFVHADLHPGNILVRPHPQPSKPQACAVFECLPLHLSSLPVCSRNPACC